MKKELLEPREAYEELANAIVLQAVHDYRRAIKKIKEYPFDHEARGTITSILRFFRSQWFNVLTEVDGERLIRMLNEEVA